MPDTIWFPENALGRLEPGRFSLLLFPVDKPERFDAVATDENRQVTEIRVKRPGFERWVWGAMRVPLATLRELRHLWLLRDRSDEYLRTLINAYIAEGARVLGIRGGNKYIDVGTLEGYREGPAAVENSDQDLSLTESSLFHSSTAEVLF